MCTILLLQGVDEAAPVLVGANRDELYARATEPPRVEGVPPVALAGVDGVHGGAWMGATLGGLLVALTNQRSLAGVDPSLRSRGEIVLAVLGAGTVDAAADVLRALDPRRYNGWNLLFGDARGMIMAYGRTDATRVELEPVRPGVHVLVNDVLDAPGVPKVARARSLLDEAVLRGDRGPDLVEALRAALADHRQPPADALPPPPAWLPPDPELHRALAAVCVHTPAYGTRSAALAALAPERLARFECTTTSPCRPTWRSLVRDGRREPDDEDGPGRPVDTGAARR